jgi:hypothetical protein
MMVPRKCHCTRLQLVQLFPCRVAIRPFPTGRSFYFLDSLKLRWYSCV